MTSSIGSSSTGSDVFYCTCIVMPEGRATALVALLGVTMLTLSSPVVSLEITAPCSSMGIYILLICLSPLYLSNPSSRCSHHSNSIEWQISLNHGVKARLLSLNIVFNSSSETYLLSRTSFGLMSKSTSALMNRM